MKTSQLEALLYYLGYYKVTDSKGNIVLDEYPGPALDRAVRDFQNTHELQITGEADDETIRIILAAVPNEEPIPEGGAEIPPAPDEDSVWSDPYIAKYLPRDEWACPCPRCGGFPIEPKPAIVRAAAWVRKEANKIRPGAVFLISSGVRCQTHNDELPGSVPNSWHVKGHAVDFYCTGLTPQQNFELAKKAPGIRYAYIMKSGWVHMDTGATE